MTRYKGYNSEEYKKAKEKYISGNCSIEKLSKEFRLNSRWLSKKLKLDGIIVNNEHNRLKFDNKVFDVIDKPEKAYWLGFLFADGYVSNGEKTNNIELSLKLSDKDHLIKYKKFLKAENDVKTDSFRCRFTITNKYFRERLIELGCTNNKSLTLRFPDIDIFSNKDLIRDFIRGYVDGDGCLCLVKGKHPQLSILGTKEFLNELQKHLPTKIIHKLSRNDYKSDSNTFVLSFNGKTAVKIAAFLYRKTKTNLSRKFNKYQKFCRLK